MVFSLLIRLVIAVRLHYYVYMYNNDVVTQQTMVYRFGSVVQTTSESLADQLKVGRTSESNWIRIFGNILTIVNVINALQIFKLFLGTTFLLKGWSKLYGSMCTYISMRISIITTKILKINMSIHSKIYSKSFHWGGGGGGYGALCIYQRNGTLI